MPRDPRRRFGWVKRQLTALDGDQAWFWSRRSLLWAMHFIKAREFLAVHMYCGEMAAKEAA